jgi:hypothetical protein
MSLIPADLGVLVKHATAHEGGCWHVPDGQSPAAGGRCPVHARLEVTVALIDGCVSICLEEVCLQQTGSSLRAAAKEQPICFRCQLPAASGLGKHGRNDLEVLGIRCWLLIRKHELGMGSEPGVPLTKLEQAPSKTVRPRLQQPLLHWPGAPGSWGCPFTQRGPTRASESRMATTIGKRVACMMF